MQLFPKYLKTNQIKVQINGEPKNLIYIPCEPEEPVEHAKEQVNIQMSEMNEDKMTETIEKGDDECSFTVESISVKSKDKLERKFLCFKWPGGGGVPIDQCIVASALSVIEKKEIRLEEANKQKELKNNQDRVESKLNDLLSHQKIRKI
jgi:hypothetical protein